MAVDLEEIVRAAVAGAVAPVREDLAATQARLDRALDALDAIRRAQRPNLGSYEDAADLTGLSVRTLRRMARRGELPVRAAGRRILVDLDALRPRDVRALAAEARMPGPARLRVAGGSR